MAGNGNGRPRCGDCVWFEPEKDLADGARVGRCLVDPPVVHLAVAPTLAGPPRPILQGLRPPVAETERCSRFAAF